MDYSRNQFPSTSRLSGKIPLQSKLSQKGRSQLGVSAKITKRALNSIRKTSNAQPTVRSYHNAENEANCNQYDKLNVRAFQDGLSLSIANAPLPSIEDSINELNAPLSPDVHPAKIHIKPKTAHLTTTTNMSDDTKSGGIFKSKPKALLREQPVVPDLPLTGPKASSRLENCNKKAPEKLFSESVRLLSAKVSKLNYI